MLTSSIRVDSHYPYFFLRRRYAGFFTLHPYHISEQTAVNCVNAFECVYTMIKPVPVFVECSVHVKIFITGTLCVNGCYR
jgi:hypothetical protein